MCFPRVPMSFLFSSSVGYSHYLEPADEIKRSIVETKINPQDPFHSVTYTASGGGTVVGVEVSATVSYTP